MSTKFNWYFATSENTDLCYIFSSMYRRSKIDSNTCEKMIGIIIIEWTTKSG